MARLISYTALLNYFPSEQSSFSIIFLAALIYILFGVKRFYSFGWLRTITSSVIVFLLIVGLFFAAGYAVAYYTLFTF
jgi:hypothetical protein